MALVLLQGNVCQPINCSSIFFSDGTGAYNASTNTTGWGSPNLATSAVTETHIIITMPDGTTIIDIENPTGLPTSDTTVEYEIAISVIDSARTTVEDGLYAIEYTVTDGVTTYTTGKKYYLFLCNKECCISNLFAKIATISDCACDDVAIKNALYADALLSGARASKNCGDTVAINNILAKLEAICESTSSGCGCS